MKNKIKEAITQGYKNLGVPESVVDGLAALGVTIVKDESGIDAFVQGETVKAMMKSIQSETDKVRTEYSNKLKSLEGEKADLEAKLNGNQNPDPEPKNPPKTEEPQPQDLAKTIAAAVAEAIKPISEELATFKSEQGAKTALATAESTFKSNDYVKKYADEATDAWERATEMYEATGKKWTAEELNTKAMGYFNKAVGKKGVDTTQPFKSDGGGEKPDFSSDVELLKADGVEFADS